MSPAIVISAFNRPASLKRLLSSISNAFFDEWSEVPLVISIDYEETSSHKEVVEISDAFQWPHGPKRIIKHSENLGLKRHVLACGDLVYDYCGIILLEDDLYVANSFYRFAADALEAYDSDPNISGISLYNYRFNEYVGMPFVPLSDGYDIYFVQTPSSWGQVWSANQWGRFRSWLSENELALENKYKLLPSSVKKWPSRNSWKKDFMCYMISEDTYFAFPQASMSTNFSDSGVNIIHDEVTQYQSILSLGYSGFRFANFHESHNKYDTYFELRKQSVVYYNPELKAYEFEVNIYNSKALAPDVVQLSGIPGRKVYRSFSGTLYPPIVNILTNLSGNSIFLTRDVGKTDKFRLLKLWKGHIHITNRDGLFMYAYLLIHRILGVLRFR